MRRQSPVRAQIPSSSDFAEVLSGAVQFKHMYRPPPDASSHIPCSWAHQLHFGRLANNVHAARGDMFWTKNSLSQ